jgi:hypothetical protein
VRPSRTPPAVGAPARVRHLSGEAEPVTIVELRDQGRCVVVAGAEGSRREFTLRRASAMFIESGRQFWPRLDL